MGRPLSLWADSAGDPEPARPPLPGNSDVDVAIVGAGFTGLWTALYLRAADPSLRVTWSSRGRGLRGQRPQRRLVLGAPAHGALVDGRGRAGRAIAMQQAMFATVDEVGRAAAEEGIDCHYAKGGYLHLATNPAHSWTLREERRRRPRSGLDEDDLRWLDGRGGRARRRGRRPRRALHAALRGDPPGSGWPAGWRPRWSGAACRSTRTPGRPPSNPAGRAPDRGTSGPTSSSGPPRATPRRSAVSADAGAALLAHDRHRAAARRHVGRDRAAPTGRRSTTPAT